MSMERKLAAGVDYGSDSVRVLLVEMENGNAVSEGVCAYPRWAEKKYCDPGKVQYRQHALDYIEGLETAMKEAIAKAGPDAGSRIASIAIGYDGVYPLPGRPGGKSPVSAGGVCRKSKCHVPFVEGSHCGGRGKGNQSGFLCRGGGLYQVSGNLFLRMVLGEDPAYDQNRSGYPGSGLDLDGAQ